MSESTAPTPQIKPPAQKPSVMEGVFWSMVNNGLAQFLVLGVFLVTARFVSKEAFGIMAICFVMIEAFRMVVIQGISTALTAMPAPTQQDYNASFFLIAGFGVIAAGTMYLTAPLIAALMDTPEMAEAMQWTSLLLVTIGLSCTHEVWLSRQMMFKTIALRSLFSILVGGGIAIYMATQGYGLMSLIAQQLITAIIAVIFLWGATRWRPSFELDWTSVADLLKASRQIMLNGVASFANSQSDTFFASYYLGAAATGIYNAAKRLILALNALIAGALGAVSLPAFAEIQNDEERLKHAYLKAVRMTSFVTAPFYAGVAVLSPEIIGFLLGQSWIDTAPVFSILAIGAFFYSFGQYNHNILVIKGKTHWQTALTVFYALVNVALFIAIARYGLIALASAFTARVILLYPLSAAGPIYLLKVPILSYIKVLASSIVPAVLMAALIWFAKDHIATGNFLTLAIMVPAGVMIYATMQWKQSLALLSDIKRNKAHRH